MRTFIRKVFLVRLLEQCLFIYFRAVGRRASPIYFCFSDQ
jgi:hypothetical protein